MSKLENKVAVITGGTSGIGLATAERFVREGAHVVVTGRSQDALDAAVRRLGARATGVRGDVAKLDDLDRLFAQVRDRHGRVDVLFVNAGIAPFVPFEDATEAHFDQVVGVNLKGAFFTIQRALPLLSDGASIILTASVAASSGFAGTSVYSATKAALRSLGRTLSSELAPRRIRVNTLSPGMIDTPLIGKLGLSPSEREGFEAAVIAQAPAARAGHAEEMAGAALFLASDDSSYVYGAELVADGGLTQV